MGACAAAFVYGVAVKIVLATSVGVPLSIPGWAPGSVKVISASGREGVLRVEVESWLDPTEVGKVDEVADAILPVRLPAAAAEFCVAEEPDILTAENRLSPY